MTRPSLTTVELRAITPGAARKEAQSHWPADYSSIHGYAKTDDCIYISGAHPVGVKAPIATAKRNRGGKPTRFTATGPTRGFKP